MEEQNAAPAPADTAAPAETPAPQVDEVEAAMPEGAGQRTPTPNKYKQEVENVLAAYEKKQARIAKEREAQAAAEPPPEPQGLLEGESWDSIYKEQPEPVQRAMAEMRKAFTRKTQELSAERRKLEAQNQALMQSGLMEELTAQAGAAPEDFDPFNPDHIKQVIESKVAARLKEVLEPLHKQNQQHEAKAKYESFKEQHPDLLQDDSVKKGVYDALQKDPSLKLEQAYWMVKGRMADKAQQAAFNRAALQRRAAQRAALVTDRGVRPGKPVLSPDLKDASAFEIYQALKAQRK
jgi:hypothetical protein|tara:strand:+ start:1776 stop:2654 length:879 start_codon:yes stop_codon:yes gene_type:complete